MVVNRNAVAEGGAESLVGFVEPLAGAEEPSLEGHLGALGPEGVEAPMGA